MPAIVLTTIVNAPAERCFDLARSVDLHVATQTSARERAVAGRTSGLMEGGESVTWRARHFGIHWHLTSKIVEFERPRRFRDEQQEGPFERFEHDHIFIPSGERTIMIDRIVFRSPVLLLGRLVDRLVMKRHLSGILRARSEGIRAVAESDMARRFLARKT